MITSFFKTSKPIHYIIFSVVLMALSFYQRTFAVNFDSNPLNYLNELAYLFVLIASLFTVIFIVTKNNLTQNNSFAALFFCLFIGVSPQVLEHTSTLISNLFILFSLRRILSLKNKTNIKKKLLDASLWICLATLFDSFSFFFFAPLIIGIALYSVFEIKNILIPFCGVLVFGILWAAFNLVVHSQLPILSDKLPDISFDMRNLVIQNNTLFTLFIAAVLLCGIVNYFLSGSFNNRQKRPSILLLILITTVGFIAFLFNQSESMEVYVFIVAPSAILMANFSETTKFSWITDVIIVSLFVLSAIQIPFNIS